MMNCTRVRQIVNDGDGGLRRVLGNLHLARCRACRAEARRVRALTAAVQTARFEPPAELLARILEVPGAAAEVGGRDARPTKSISIKGDRRMRLIAFAGLALLVVAIGAAVVIPGRRTQADARSILIAAAQAAEEANSVYAVVTGAKSAKETSTGVALQPFRVETWAGPRGLYGRNSAADGKLTMALSLDADTGKLWFYDGDKKVLYVAGLASLEPKIGEFIPRISRQFSEVTVAQVKSFATGKVPRDAKETVAFETRGGHKVAIVVISSTGTLSTSRKSAVGRWIFEVDTDTHRLLNVHRYVRVQGQPEQLVEAIEDIQYDVPIPAGLANLQPPEGAKTAKAFVSFEKTKSVLSLVLKADGKEIMRSSVPLALGNEHPR